MRRRDGRAAGSRFNGAMLTRATPTTKRRGWRWWPTLRVEQHLRIGLRRLVLPRSSVLMTSRCTTLSSDYGWFGSDRLELARPLGPRRPPRTQIPARRRRWNVCARRWNYSNRRGPRRVAIPLIPSRRCRVLGKTRESRRSVNMRRSLGWHRAGSSSGRASACGGWSRIRSLLDWTTCSNPYR